MNISSAIPPTDIKHVKRTVKRPFYIQKIFFFIGSLSFLLNRIPFSAFSRGERSFVLPWSWPRASFTVLPMSYSSSSSSWGLVLPGMSPGGAREASSTTGVFPASARRLPAGVSSFPGEFPRTPSKRQQVSHSSRVGELPAGPSPKPEGASTPRWPPDSRPALHLFFIASTNCCMGPRCEQWLRPVPSDEGWLAWSPSP